MVFSMCVCVASQQGKSLWKGIGMCIESLGSGMMIP